MAGTEVTSSKKNKEPTTKIGRTILVDDTLLLETKHFCPDLLMVD